MRNIRERDVNIEQRSVTQSPEYLKGYRDGVRDRRAIAHPMVGDGLLGALVAIALMAGVGYVAYNYISTGRFLPTEATINLSSPNNSTAQP